MKIYTIIANYTDNNAEAIGSFLHLPEAKERAELVMNDRLAEGGTGPIKLGWMERIHHGNLEYWGYDHATNEEVWRIVEFEVGGITTKWEEGCTITIHPDFDQRKESLPECRVITRKIVGLLAHMSHDVSRY